MLEYQHPDTTLTLESGLAEYYASGTDLVNGRGVSPAAREFFRCHDAAHVVFGCDTTLLNEAMVKMWSFFGTTRGLGLVREYRLPESQEIYEQLEWGSIGRTALRSVTVVPRVMARCLRMHKRWPWPDFETYRPLALRELRREYGIQVLIVD
ncbi:MAG: hypothetical protein O7G30_07010 [Proteobacteria bacterium]|nr:hypothetical protein [Pseudomonadota bacterium]